MPKRIPIKALRGLAKDQGLAQAILIGWDGGLQHVVTWGKTVADCEQAAQAGNKIKEGLGWAPSARQAVPRRARLRLFVWRDILVGRPGDDADNAVTRTFFALHLGEAEARAGVYETLRASGYEDYIAMRQIELQAPEVYDAPTIIWAWSVVATGTNLDALQANG